MCLALYANGVLRLWNMLDGRCTFKIKVGIDEDDSEEELAHGKNGSSDEGDADDYSDGPRETFKRTLV